MAGVAANMANANPSATNYSSSCALKPLIGLPFHQEAADELGHDHLGGAGEEGWGEGLEGLRGRGGYGSGFETCLLSRLIIGPKKHPWKQGAEYNLINARASAVFLRASMFACFCQVRGCIHAISKRKPAFRSCKIQC